MYPAGRLAMELLQGLKPPPQIRHSEWAEQYFVLPEGSSAKPGRFRPWPPQRGILDAMGDPLIPRVTVIKASRVGYTKCLISSIGGTAALDPCAMILLVPTDDDARGFAVDEVEPSFEATPVLRGLIKVGRVDGRNTLTMKTIAGGGSLKILSARAPRNLRRHDAKKLYCDEVDGMEVTKEGDPVALAEKRTLAHPDRKIIIGSTPTDDASLIAKSYAESDRRVFEVPCPQCGVTFEILWPHIRWPRGEPKKAALVCPHCLEAANRERPVEGDIFADRPALIIPETCKREMVDAGDWVAQAPQVEGHAGFRLNAFTSLHANASWGNLAVEFEKAKRSGPAELQVFANTVEGRVWKSTLDEVDTATLAARVEDFGIRPAPSGASRIPADVLAAVAGVDTQDDRFEAVLWGFNETEWFALDQHVIWGDPADSVTQAELDTYLRTTWLHPHGWTLGIEAAAIDSQGHKTQAVYDFCRPRLGRRIYPIISRAGARRIWEPSRKKLPDGTRLFVVGHDGIKTLVLQHIALPLETDGEATAGRCRFSNDLPLEFFDQLTGEKRTVRYIRNRPIAEFRRVKQGQPVEALDATCYAWAARTSLKINFAERRARRGIAAAKSPSNLGALSEMLNR
jgi:phage terminase large subunit GpA-like protein